MDLADLYRSLAALHRAGVGWPEALASAAPGRLGDAWARLDAGRPLSEALAGVAPALDLALLRAGEHSGRLEAVLERLALRHEQEQRLGRARRTALVYPVLLAHIAAVLLPLPDVMLGRASAGLLWSLGVLLPLYLGLWLSRPRRLGAAGAGRAPPPAVGPWRSAVEESDSRALLALSDALDAGVPLAEGLTLAAQAGGGGRAAQDLGRAREALASGTPLLSSFTALPLAMRERLASAEHAGELPQAARREAERLAFDVTHRRQRWAAILPTVLMLFAGAVIGLRVILFYAEHVLRYAR